MIYYDCCLYNDNAKEASIKNIIDWLKEEGMITTQKTTRGMIITVLNYDTYQSRKEHGKDTGKNFQRTSKELRNHTINNNDNNVNNVKKKREKKRTFIETSNEFQLSKLLLDLILKRDPNHKKPDLQEWSKHIDYLIRIDGREPERIKKVINWCQQDDFWMNNILSTKKLRKQFNQLNLKLKKEEEYI